MAIQLPPIRLVSPLIGEAEANAVLRVLRSGQLAQGPEVAAFEAEFAESVGTKHAVAVNSGTAALHCALAAAGVGEGDEVITSPFTFAATATPILMQRAKPCFVDVDELTYNLATDGVLAALTAKTKAVIGVDLFGLPMDYSALHKLHDRGIVLVEDACQAIGAARGNRLAGDLADIGAFSFYATKNIMTGEGGMLTTNDDAFAAVARRFRQHGQGDRYEYVSLGYNYRMTDILGALGRVQFRQLELVTRRRRENAAMYDRLLAGIGGVTTPFVPADVKHCYHQYTIVIDSAKTNNGAKRDDVRKALSEAGIATGIYYPTPLHVNPLFNSLGYGPGSFPVAERLAQQVLSLPVHPSVTARDVERVALAIRQAVGA